jgi:hypothetical protein
VKLNAHVCELFGSSSPEVCALEVSGEGIRYMLMSRHQYAGQNCDIKLANNSSDNIAVFEYFGITLTNQNCIHEELGRV